MNLPIVFMYSGQGSQYYHMGQSLFAENPVFKNALEKTDLIYQEMTGDSIVKHLYDDQKNKSIPFTQTIQELEKKEPAIYIDVGPSGTLATFVKYNLSAESQSIPVPFITPFGNDAKNLEKLEQAVQNK